MQGKRLFDPFRKTTVAGRKNPSDTSHGANLGLSPYISPLLASLDETAKFFTPRNHSTNPPKDNIANTGKITDAQIDGFVAVP